MKALFKIKRRLFKMEFYVTRIPNSDRNEKNGGPRGRGYFMGEALEGIEKLKKEAPVELNLFENLNRLLENDDYECYELRKIKWLEIESLCNGEAFQLIVEFE